MTEIKGLAVPNAPKKSKCGARWTRGMNEWHQCVLPEGHKGPHQCAHCGIERGKALGKGPDGKYYPE